MQTQSPEPKQRYEYRIFPALFVIAIGVIFLIRNLGVEIPFLSSTNWWAWLILLGALAPLSRAYSVYRARGHIDADVLYPLLTGIVLVVVAVMFLLGLDWQVWWPLFVILGGLFTLVRRRPHRRDRERSRHGTDDAKDSDDPTLKN